MLMPIGLEAPFQTTGDRRGSDISSIHMEAEARRKRRKRREQQRRSVQQGATSTAIDTNQQIYRSNSFPLSHMDTDEFRRLHIDCDETEGRTPESSNSRSFRSLFWRWFRGRDTTVSADDVAIVITPPDDAIQQHPVSILATSPENLNKQKLEKQVRFSISDESDTRVRSCTYTSTERLRARHFSNLNQSVRDLPKFMAEYDQKYGDAESASSPSSSSPASKKSCPETSSSWSARLNAKRIAISRVLTRRSYNSNTSSQQTETETGGEEELS